jgi:hypothetical protein
MAIQTRYAGDANGVNNFDAKTDGTLGTIIATGLTKAPVLVKIAGVTFTQGESATGGAVETILRALAIDSTITMYQVDTDRMSVYLEATGAQSGESYSATGEGAYIQTNAQIASALQTRLQALNGGGNIGVAGTVTAGNLTVASSGFKLA